MASSFLSGCGDTLPTDESDTLPPDVIVLLPDAEEDAGYLLARVVVPAGMEAVEISAGG